MSILSEIEGELLQRRLNAQAAADRRREELFNAFPDVLNADTRCRQALIDKFRALRLHGDTDAAETELKAARTEYLRQLAAAGLKEEDLLPERQCKKCGDTGYIEGKRCSCLKNEYIRRLYSNAGISGEGTFETFDINVFKNEDQRSDMQKLCRFSEKYADSFTQKGSRTLVFTGQTGTGKTFLSNCIAARIIARGFSVLCLTSYQIAGVFLEAMRDRTKLELMYTADLLVIDDLGMEQMLSNVVIEQLFAVLNERLKNERAIIISTNLTPGQMTERYTERITSRLFERGKSLVFEFKGEDVRLNR